MVVLTFIVVVVAPPNRIPRAVATPATSTSAPITPRITLAMSDIGADLNLDELQYVDD